jgi:hypothetical protein
MPVILPKLDASSFCPTWRNRLLLTLVLAGCCALNPVSVRAWGPEGHLQIAELALQAMDAEAAAQLREILGSSDMAAVDEACNWPDVVRKTPQWEWSAPQHFVNIPRTASLYERERDCPDGLCVTEAIKKYAGQLADRRLDLKTRREAFAWLCHLVADLHQPLHAGYLDDRGANYVQISYQGEQENLHQFWDRMLIRERFTDPLDWQKRNAGKLAWPVGNTWNPSETDDWTSESHELVKTASYPPGNIIQSDFADRSWVIIQEQWIKAGRRLARILNATLGAGKVVLSREP